MSRSTIKFCLITLAVSIVYPFLMVKTAFILDQEGIRYTHIASESLYALKAGGIILSTITLILPWILLKQPIPSEAKSDSMIRLFKKETTILITGFLFLITPIIYGLVLFILGTSITDFYFFLIASAIGSLIWGVYNVKRSKKAA